MKSILKNLDEVINLLRKFEDNQFKTNANEKIKSSINQITVIGDN